MKLAAKALGLNLKKTTTGYSYEIVDGKRTQTRHYKHEFRQYFEDI